MSGPEEARKTQRNIKSRCDRAIKLLRADRSDIKTDDLVLVRPASILALLKTVSIFSPVSLLPGLTKVNILTRAGGGEGEVGWISRRHDRHLVSRAFSPENLIKTLSKNITASGRSISLLHILAWGSDATPSARLMKFCGRMTFDQVARIRMSLGKTLLAEYLVQLRNSPLSSYCVVLYNQE